MKLSDILHATNLQLRDHWGGMNILAPFDISAELDRRPREGLRGRVTFSIGYGEHRREETHEAAVSETVTREMLKSLAGLPMVRGEYEPSIDHTDDYPSIEIDVTTPEGLAVIFTESQGELHVPWAVRLDGVTYVIDSEEPGKALKRLRRALGAKKLDEMIDQAERVLYRD